jgi:hypothetical protein
MNGLTYGLASVGGYFLIAIGTSIFIIVESIINDRKHPSKDWVEFAFMCMFGPIYLIGASLLWPIYWTHRLRGL